VNVAQVWSVIAVMAAGLGTMITLTFRYVGAHFDIVDERFTRIDERFRSLEKKMEDRFDTLDRDLQRVIERVFR
jgi:hypothetical protein